MDRNSTPPRCPYCVRLATLMQHFKRINRGPHQWAVRPVSGIFVSIDGEVARYVLAGYSNPKTSGLPNNLVYGIPLNIHRDDTEASPELIACFDPSSAIALLRGLYWAGDTFEYDPARDWGRFWRPIEAVLAGTITTNNSDRKVLAVRSYADRQTMEGVSHAESIASCLKWWTECKQILQNAIHR
jgi:hypothetical protein